MSMHQITSYEMDMVERLWTKVISLSDREVSIYLKPLRVVAEILKITDEQFYHMSDGYYLREEEVEIDDEL